MTEVYLVRHGETSWNTEGRFQGSLDIGLNDIGRQQAEAIAARLANVHVDAIISSDLSRALTTARAIASPHHLEVGIDSNLRERRYGIFEGLTISEMRRKHPAEVAAWESHDPGYTVPEGESMETFYARVVAALKIQFRVHAGKTIVVVAHGGVLDMAYRRAVGQPLYERRRCKIPNAALNQIRVEGEAWTIVAWADLAHLTGSIAA